MAEQRFGALRELRNKQAEPGPVAVAAPVVKPEPSREASTAGLEARRGPGRPGGGKRSNPDYERLNLLVRKTTRRKVDMRMLQEPESAVDLSELVDRLLNDWVG